MNIGYKTMDFFVVLCISANNIYICSLPINNFVMAGQKDGFSGEKAYVLPPACIAEMEKDPVGELLHFTDIGYYPVAHNHFRRRVGPGFPMNTAPMLPTHGQSIGCITAEEWRKP